MVDLVDRDSSDRAPYGATIPPFAFVDKVEQTARGEQPAVAQKI